MTRKFATDNIFAALTLAHTIGGEKDMLPRAIKLINRAEQAIDEHWPKATRDTDKSHYDILSPAERTLFDAIWAIKVKNAAQKGAKQSAARAFRQTDMTQETAEKIREAYQKHTTDDDFQYHVSTFINQRLYDNYEQAIKQDRKVVEQNDQLQELAHAEKMAKTGDEYWVNEADRLRNIIKT